MEQVIFDNFVIAGGIGAVTFLGYVLRLIYNKIVAIEQKISDYKVLIYRMDQIETNYKDLIVKMSK